MGKRDAKNRATKKHPAPQRGRLLWAILGVAVLAGAATWVLLPGQSPLAGTPTYRGGPRLAVDKELIDFGTVQFGKLVQARFLLRNVGDQPLHIAANPPVEVVEGC